MGHFFVEHIQSRKSYKKTQTVFAPILDMLSLTIDVIYASFLITREAYIRLLKITSGLCTINLNENKSLPDENRAWSCPVHHFEFYHLMRGDFRF